MLWLGLPPERFFQPPMFRIENTPDLIASQLAQDPNLTPAAAETIAGLVRDLYGNLAAKDRDVTVHLRAAATFTPEAARLLGEILSELQSALESGAPHLGQEE